MLLAGLVVLVGTGGFGVYLALNPPTLFSAPTLTPGPTPSSEETPTPTPTPSPTPYVPPSYAMNGPGTYEFASGDSAVFGTAGTLRKYRVAVETGYPSRPEEFARDGRRDARATRAAGSAATTSACSASAGEAAGTNFTVYLVTPGTARKLCLAAGYDIFWRGEPYTSCYTGRRF